MSTRSRTVRGPARPRGGHETRARHPRAHLQAGSLQERRHARGGAPLGPGQLRVLVQVAAQGDEVVLERAHVGGQAGHHGNSIARARRPGRRLTIFGVTRDAAVRALAAAAIGLLVVVGVWWIRSPESTQVKVGQEAPDLELPSLGGVQKTRLSSFRGRPVLLVMFVANCQLCEAEVPEIERLQPADAPARAHGDRRRRRRGRAPPSSGSSRGTR